MTTPRTALVTGGGGGIGAAICRVLATSGHRVAVADVDLDAAAPVAAEVQGCAVRLDVTDAASVEAGVTEARSRLGPIEILVNAAGWDELRPFIDTDESFMAQVLGINLCGCMRVTRTVLPDMVERGWGRVVSVASDAGRVGSSLEAIYSGAKGGVIAFSKALAREVARHGITVNTVCPGPTDTPLLHRIVASGPEGERVIAAMTRSVPMRRLGTPEDVAGAVAYLCSEAAAYVTGQTLSVSGGLTMV